MSKGGFPPSPAVKAPCPPLTPQDQPAGLTLSPNPGVPVPGSSAHWTVSSHRSGTERCGVGRGGCSGPLPGTQREAPAPSSQRLLVPWRVAQCPASMGPWADVSLLAWEWLPCHSMSSSEAIHVFALLWDALPQGPRGRRAGPVWLVLPVTEAGGPTSDLKQDPGPHGLCRPTAETQNRLPIDSAPRGLPPTQKSQCCREEAQVLISEVFLGSSHY